MNEFTITKNDSGRTILKFLERVLSDVPKSKIEKLFRNKDIRLNGKRTNDKKIHLKEGDFISVYGVDTNIQKFKYSPVQKNFEVIYEDKNILVVNKHAGDVMHDEKNSLDAQVLNHLKFKQVDSFVPSSIGRLDKVTSGIVVYAKNYDTLRQMKESSNFFEKIYEFKSDLPNEITTDFKISHDEDRKREVCGDQGKETKTIFFFEKNKKFAKLITGRKHQIRASLSKLGFPIYGDRKYGGKIDSRVFLHSYSIKFRKLKGDLEYLNNMELISIPNWN